MPRMWNFWSPTKRNLPCTAGRQLGSILLAWDSPPTDRTEMYATSLAPGVGIRPAATSLGAMFKRGPPIASRVALAPHCRIQTERLRRVGARVVCFEAGPLGVNDDALRQIGRDHV